MTYAQLDRITESRSLPIAGQNNDGEAIVIAKGDGFYKLTTAQHNGWNRIEIIYANGDREEHYER